MQNRLQTISRLDVPLQKIVLVLARVTLGLLFFTQLWWKVPPSFGCPPDFSFATADANGNLRRTSGLCDWIGKEIANPRYPAYKDLLTGFISPNLPWMAFFIVGGEIFICFSLMTGFLTRIGGLVGFLLGINLFIGLTAVPGEWDWTYLMLPLLNALFIVVGGRFIGLDALLYARLKQMADKGSPIAAILARIVA